MWLWLVKVKEVNPSDYLGRYYNDELSTYYDLVAKDNSLYLTQPKLDDVKIEQINEAYFSSHNRNFSDIRFKRDHLGEISGFSVSNGGVENMVFLRK